MERHMERQRERKGEKVSCMSSKSMPVRVPFFVTKMPGCKGTLSVYMHE